MRCFLMMVALLACMAGVMLAEPAVPTTPAPHPLPPVTSDMQELARRQQAFAVTLYGKLAAQPGNLLLSPYSVATALSMAAEGARGQTATEMAAVLHTAGWDVPVRQAATTQLADRLVGPGEAPPYTLTIANALWPTKGVALAPDFAHVCLTTYRAPMQALDFADRAGACRTINGWVAAITAQQITAIVAPEMLNAQTRMVLTNTVYFKGQWEHAFRPAATTPQPWYGAATPTPARQTSPPSPVRLMNQMETLPYWESKGTSAHAVPLQVVELPYRGNVFSLVVLLPTVTAATRASDPAADLRALAAVEEGMGAGRLAVWLARLTPTQVELYLPKFAMQPAALALAEPPGESRHAGGLWRGRRLQWHCPWRAKLVHRAGRPRRVH